jgi:hypothetical protein
MRPTERCEMFETRPRRIASSAISLWLQWLIGRSLSDGFSQVIAITAHAARYQTSRLSNDRCPSSYSDRGDGIPDAQRDPRSIGRLAIRNVEHRKIGRLIAAPYRLPARDIAILEFGMWHSQQTDLWDWSSVKEVAAKRHNAVTFRGRKLIHTIHEH